MERHLPVQLLNLFGWFAIVVARQSEEHRFEPAFREPHLRSRV